MSMAQTIWTCPCGCHDVCDLLLASLAKVQASDTRPGRFRPQMRRCGRSLADRLLLTGCTKRLCHLMAREAKALEEEEEKEAGAQRNGRKRLAARGSGPGLELRTTMWGPPSPKMAIVGDGDSAGTGQQRRVRLSSYVRVTCSFQPVRVTEPVVEDSSVSDCHGNRRVDGNGGFDRRGTGGRPRRRRQRLRGRFQTSAAAAAAAFCGREA